MHGRAAALPGPPSPPPTMLRHTDFPTCCDSARHCANSLRGTSTLHAAGRIHRDLKPSNVLVTRSGRVVVLDFGLVAEIDRDYTAGTHQQHVAGSAAYMSPEQAVGQPLSASSDWYAVGVMLYESLTGVLPYQGHVYDILSRKQRTDPRPPSTLVDGVPADLDQLTMDLLKRDPAARPSGRDVVARLSRPPASVQVGVARFVGREKELREVSSLWRRVKEAGRPAILRVEGPPGIGRTRFMREVVKRVRQRGGTPLKARCYPWERIPLRAIDGLIDNLTRLLQRAPPQVLRELALEPLQHLAAMFPTLERVETLDIVPAASIEAGGLAQLADLMAWLTSRYPMLVALDDAHHADEASVLALRRVLEHDGMGSLLVVLTHPTGVRGHLDRLEEEPWAGPFSTTLHLPPLSTSDALHIVTELLDQEVDDPLVQSVASAAQGHPSTLVRRSQEQLAHAPTADALTEAVAAAIDGLTDGPRRLLDMFAIAEAPMTLALALRAADLATDSRAMLTLKAHHLVMSRGDDAVAIRSEGISGYCLDGLTAAERRDRHAALAETLEQCSADPAPCPRVPGVLDPLDARVRAWHWAAAGQPDRAAVACWSGAREAVQEGRWGEARWLLKQALEQATWTPRERAAILGDLGRALLFEGNPALARHHLLEAVALLPSGACQRHALRAAEAALVGGAWEQGLIEVRALLWPYRRSWWTSIADVWSPHAPNRGVAAQATRANAPESGPFAAEAAWIGTTALRLVDPPRATRLSRQVKHLLSSEGNALRQEAERLRGVQASADAFEALRVAAGDPQSPDQAHISWCQAEAALGRGRFEEAAHRAHHAETLWRRSGTGFAWQRNHVRALGWRARLWNGEVERVTSALALRLQQARQVGDPVALVELVGGDLILGHAVEGVHAAWKILDEATNAWKGPRPVRQEALLDVARAWLMLAECPGHEVDQFAWRLSLGSTPWDAAVVWRVRGFASLTTGRRSRTRRALRALRSLSRPHTLAWAAGLAEPEGLDHDAALQAASPLDGAARQGQLPQPLQKLLLPRV